MTTESMDLPDCLRDTVETKKVDAARERSNAGAPQLAGTLWFIGWLFTIGFAQLVWWKAVVGVLAWPYFLGVALH